MTRPDIEAIKDAEFSGELYLTDDEVMGLVAHIDALEGALRGAVGRCGSFDIIEGDLPCRARDDECPACRAALALLDGSES